jgi:hypothetical protein
VSTAPTVEKHVIPKQSGNKKDNVTVIYTPWSNLKKDGSMAVGQVSFKDQKMVCCPHRNPLTSKPDQPYISAGKEDSRSEAGESYRQSP